VGTKSGQKAITILWYQYHIGSRVNCGHITTADQTVP
jgi:hypothetical protein